MAPSLFKRTATRPSITVLSLCVDGRGMVLNITSLFKRSRLEGSEEISSTSTQGSILHGAKNTQINGGSFAINIINKTISGTIGGLLFLALCGAFYLALSYLQDVHTEQREALWSLIEPVTSRAKESPDILYHRVAINAVLNTGGRAEDAKCHPGTREEVIGLIEQWMYTRDNPNRILWLSGPAGGGKTAIMKTIAERSKDRSVHTINFFFFRGDPTRNNARPIVATLLYQILQLYPAAHDAVDTILSNNPLTLDASIEEQFDRLISPLSSVIREFSPDGAPIVISVDGLDECDVDAKRSQEQVLRALDNLVTEQNSIFLALMASRPESHIQMAFNQLLSKAPTIFLDAHFSPENDIRRFVMAELHRIKASHPNAHLLPDGWPSKSSIAAMVEKSSGQFIYAATVIRFLASSSAVPSLSLERVQGIVPIGRNSPFTHLDSVYNYILDQVDDRELTHDLLSSKLHSDRILPAANIGPPLCHPSVHDHCLSMYEEWSRVPVLKDGPITDILEIINPRYTEPVIMSCLTDLSAIVQYRDKRLIFYHASMTDFLLDPARSNLSYIDLDRFTANILPAVWRSDKTLPTFVAWHPFKILSVIPQAKTTTAMTYAILTVNPSWSSSYNRGYHNVLFFLKQISRLYYPHDILSYMRIIRRWTTWAESQDRLPPMELKVYWDYSYQVPFLAVFVFLAKLEKWTAFVFDFIRLWSF